jgi:hypothetical protein
MIPEPPEYVTYLLRLWRAGGAAEAGWRAALENPHSGERRAFRDLAALFAFLEERTRGPLPIAEETPAADPEDARPAPDSGWRPATS